MAWPRRSGCRSVAGRLGDHRDDGGLMANEQDVELWPVMSGLHRMLLHLAGRMPDDWMTHLRRMVGEYELGYLPDTVSGGVATLAVALPAGDIELLRRL